MLGATLALLSKNKMKFLDYNLENEDTYSRKNKFFDDCLIYFHEKEFTISVFCTDIVDYTDGIAAFKMSSSAETVFLILTNPKIRGGTFSIENLEYLHLFFDFLDSDNTSTPLLFGLSSAGVRLTQSRTMFNSIWGVLPRLFAIRKKRPYFAFAHELCLGAGALFFGQAHFRIVSGEKSLLNLTGPQVINHFFGKENNFYQYASAEHQIERHLYIQEIYLDLKNSIDRILSLVKFTTESKLVDHSLLSFKSDLGKDSADIPRYSNHKHNLFISTVSDQHSELFPHYSNSGISYLAVKKNKKFAMLINPLDHPINTLSVATIEKYIEAINVFKALKLPLISITDTPGGDPRQKNSDQNVIMKTLSLIELMIDYPYPKIGLIAGRCFGGSGLLALPTVNKSMGLYALEGAKIGAMSDESIEKLAKANTKSYEEWKTSQLSHKTDLSDLIKTKNLNGIIKFNQLSEFIDQFLEGSI